MSSAIHPQRRKVRIFVIVIIFIEDWLALPIYLSPLGCVDWSDILIIV
jgi:hypothetical protein